MILIDAHVHIHECFNLEIFLESAKKNFLDSCKSIKEHSFQGVLCLTESIKSNFYSQLDNIALENKKIGNWRINKTQNENTLLLEDEDGNSIFVLAGRQIVSRENLEVLALGLMEIPEDGKNISDVIQSVINLKSIPIIPWGVGKWIGQRKQIIENLISNHNFYHIYLGDNGNRPIFWGKPKIFHIARENGVFNIPGSDPLPFSNGLKKPGSFGIKLNGDIDRIKPFDDLYEKIINSKIEFETYGKLESPFKFLRNQVSMQYIKRISSKL